MELAPTVDMGLIAVAFAPITTAQNIVAIFRPGILSARLEMVADIVGITTPFPDENRDMIPQIVVMMAGATVRLATAAMPLEISSTPPNPEITPT